MAEAQKSSFAAADQQTKIRLLNASEHFFNSDGMELIELGDGSAYMIMRLQPRHFNRRGELPYAWAAVLLEQTARMAAMSYGHAVTSEQLSINYHQRADGDVLHAHATEKNRGKYLGVYTVEVFDGQENIVVSGTLTVYFQEQELYIEDMGEDLKL